MLLFTFFLKSKWIHNYLHEGLTMDFGKKIPLQGRHVLYIWAFSIWQKNFPKIAHLVFQAEW